MNRVIFIHKGKERPCSGYSMNILIKQISRSQTNVSYMPHRFRQIIFIHMQISHWSSPDFRLETSLRKLWKPTEESHFNPLCAPESCWKSVLRQVLSPGEIVHQIKSHTHYHMTGAVLSLMYLITFNPHSNPQRSTSYFPYFIEEKTRAQR